MNNISSSDKKAYAEIDYIIHNMDPIYLYKVPTKLVDFFEAVMDSEYEVNIDNSIPLYENNLEEYTFEMLNVLNLNYWCEDEERKEELLNIMKKSKANYKMSEHIGEDVLKISREEIFKEIEEKINREKEINNTKIEEVEDKTKEKEKPKFLGFFQNILKNFKKQK